MKKAISVAIIFGALTLSATGLADSVSQSLTLKLNNIGCNASGQDLQIQLAGSSAEFESFAFDGLSTQNSQGVSIDKMQIANNAFVLGFGSMTCGSESGNSVTISLTLNYNNKAASEASPIIQVNNTIPDGVDANLQWQGGGLQLVSGSQDLSMMAP